MFKKRPREAEVEEGRSGIMNTGGRGLSDSPPVSALAAAIRDYLDRNPHDACEPPGWIGATLWAYDLFPGKPTREEVRAAIEELGGIEPGTSGAAAMKGASTPRSAGGVNTRQG